MCLSSEFIWIRFTKSAAFCISLEVEKHDDIDIDEWVNGFQIFLKGSRWQNYTCLDFRDLNSIIPSREDQISFCFFVYDLEDSGFITRSQFLFSQCNRWPKIHSHSEFHSPPSKSLLKAYWYKILNISIHLCFQRWYAESSYELPCCKPKRWCRRGKGGHLYCVIDFSC